MSNNLETFKTFEDFKYRGDTMLKENLYKGIYGYGFENPSKTQQIGCPPCLAGHDTIIQAESGTGKSLTFSIPAIQEVVLEDKYPQVMIVCPTRDIALQHCELLESLTMYMDGFKIIKCIGKMGSSKDMVNRIKDGAHIICGTTGRIKDMIERNAFDPYKLRMIILDEADQMLENDFKYDIMDILKFCNEEVQLCCFSATMKADTLEFTKTLFRSNPKIVLLPPDTMTLEGIKQFYVSLDREEHKLEVLADLYNFISVSQSIIFVNSIKRAMWLESMLRKHDFSMSVITGEMTQADRNTIIDEFRTGRSRILISTDLLARGIDVKGLKLVINYDFPNNRENYIHRIGRCGRYGSKGVAINLVTSYDGESMQEVETFYSTQINELPDDIEDLI